jgi:hypothetical protein
MHIVIPSEVEESLDLGAAKEFALDQSEMSRPQS